MRAAAPPDLAAIAALRDSVGWGAQDWALRAAIEQPDARCLVVEEADGRIVGVGSGISYGALGIVGNMIVAEGHRRRGIGAAILDAVVDFLRERGCSRLELSATPSGRPLYAGRGFTAIEPGVMVSLPRGAVEGHPSVRVDAERDAREVAAFDAPRFGGDRRRLLEPMAADPARPMLVAREGSAIVGYAWLRGDAARLGPFIADRPDVAAAIAADAFRRTPEAAELTMNLPASNAPATAWLRAIGIAVEPWDGRMALGPPIPRRDDTIYGNVVGALG